jgi:7-carboxy-7-deazaguanine synthase
MFDADREVLVDDIFSSLQGESSSTGYPTTFVRLYGCNIYCSYCDQPQNRENMKRMTISEIVEKTNELGIHRVCVTGGEPAIQPNWKELVNFLMFAHDVSVETNGCCPLPSHWKYPSRPRFIVDVKSPSSKMEKYNIYSNLLHLTHEDEIKFVLADEVDLKYALHVIDKLKKDYPSDVMPPQIVFSPVIYDYFKEEDRKWAQKLANFIIEHKMDYVRLQVQFHKVIGVK